MQEAFYGNPKAQALLREAGRAQRPGRRTPRQTLEL